MHLLRSTPETMKYRGMVEELVDVKAATGDTSGREKEAIFRLCTAYLISRTQIVPLSEANLGFDGVSGEALMNLLDCRRFEFLMVDITPRTRLAKSSRLCMMPTQRSSELAN